jgi:xanthine dehydrogenase accessory factor
MDDIDFDVDYFVLATHHRDDDRISCEALKRGIPYVAVVASGKKTGIITDYLREHGITDEDLERFHAPAGLDLEAKTAEEIALSILSEMVMHRNGGTGHPMRTMVSEENVPEQQP